MNDDRERKEERLQPAYVVTYESGFEAEDRVQMADYLTVLWKRRLIILLGTLGCALLALLVSLFLPKVYKAEATLLILPPTFSTELRPSPLSIDTYQSLVESPAVIRKVRERMLQTGTLEKGESPGSMTTEIYPSRNRDQAYRPLITLTVESDTREKAKAAANAWADTFVEESSGLASREKLGTLEFIEKEYPATRKRLTELDRKLQETEDRYDREINQQRSYWGERIAAFQARWNLESIRYQLLALQSQLSGQEGVLSQLNETQIRIKHLKDTLDQLKKQVQEHPQFLIVSKAITDDALWDRIGSDFSGETARELQSLKLRTEEINLVYQELIQQLAETQVAFDALVPQEQHLENRAESLRAEIDELNALVLEKDEELQQLERSREQALASLERRKSVEVGELKRELESSTESFKSLSQVYEDSRIARAEADQDVKIGAYAVEPGAPVRPKILLNTLLGLVAGLFGFAAVAFILEYVEMPPPVRSHKTATGPILPARGNDPALPDDDEVSFRRRA